MFVCIVGNNNVDRSFSLDPVNAINDVDVWSLPFAVLSSVMKYAICSSIIGPLILIDTTPLFHGSILSVDLIVPIVAFCLQFLVYVRNFASF